MDGDEPPPVPVVAIQELVNEIDSFLSEDMGVTHMSEEDIRNLREKKCIEVTVHGQTTEKVSLKKIADRFKADRDGRIIIPNNDILQHQRNLPLHETSEDVFKVISAEYKDLFRKKEEELMQNERSIELELSKLNGDQNVKEVIANICDLGKVVILTPQSDRQKQTDEQQQMQREIKAAIEGTNGNPKDQIMSDMRKILHRGVETSLLTKNNNIKSKWEALKDRRKTICENKTVFALNQVMEQFQGMSVKGMKTHSFLCKFLDKLNIKLTHSNYRTATGKKVTDEVEHDHISSWLEQDRLIINFVQAKSAEVKPWAPADKLRRVQDAVSHAEEALKELKKDVLTFKEIFGDITEDCIRKIK